MDIATQVSVGTGTHESEVKDRFKTVTFDDLKGWLVIEEFLFAHSSDEVSWRKVKGLLEDAPAPPAVETIIYENIYKIVNQTRGGGKKKRKTKKRKSSNKKKSNKKKSNKKKSSKKRRTKRR